MNESSGGKDDRAEGGADHTHYRYTITITGQGGQYAIVTMNPEQLTYWRNRGSEALAEHLTGGCDDDETPSEFNLGYHYESDYSTSGLHLEDGADLIVLDALGSVCFNKRVGEHDNDFIEVERVLQREGNGAFFETCEKGTETYELEPSSPFDPSKLSLRVTDYSTAYVLNRVLYDGVELERVSELKPFGVPMAHFVG